jgi:hypothetical protein
LIALGEAARKEVPKRGKQLGSGRNVLAPAAPVRDEQPAQIGYVQASELLSARHCLITRLYYYQLKIFQPNSGIVPRTAGRARFTLRRPAFRSIRRVGSLNRGPSIRSH